MKESNIKHLEFIQGVINRLSQKSFIIKSWSITTIAALIVYGIDNCNSQIFLIGIPISLLFWYLDAHYLWLEQIFRKLYNQVRKEKVESFSMDIKDLKNKVPFLKMIIRPTILPIYLFEIVLLIIAIIYFN